MRCLSLAEALRKCGVQVLFICREFPGHMGGQIAAFGHELALLPIKTCEADPGQDEQVVDKRLGVIWQQDAREVIEVIDNRRPDWLIVDHYGIDHRWHRRLRAVAPQLMVIDDLANRDLDCDLLLDQNFYNDPMSRYDGLVPDGCEKLLGPRYMLLRDEFINTVPKPCSSVGKVDRVVVFMGGADAVNGTEKVLLALDDHSSSFHQVDVIVGKANPHASVIQKMCGERGGYIFYQGVSNIAEICSGADLAIGAGGVAMYEWCYLGLPSLIMVTADIQAETTLALDSIGAIGYMGRDDEIDIQTVSDAVARVISDGTKLQAMCRSSRSIYKGEQFVGVAGVVDRLLKA